MNKKLLISIAILSLMITTMIGCSTKESGGSTQSPETTAKGTNGEEKKIEKVYVYNNTGVLSVTSDTSKPEAIEEVRQYIKEKTGIEVIGIVPPRGSEADKLNILLASNEPLDLFMGSMAEHQVKGAAQPLNELMDKYGENVKKFWPEEWATSWDAVSTTDGKIWAIPELPSIAGDTVLIRTDWLKKLNLQMPKTMDEYEVVLKAFKDNDPAGAGQTIPMLTNLSGLNNALAAGFMDVGYGNWLDSDGKVKPVVLNPGYKDFVAKMADWYKKGYIYKEAFSINKNQMIDLVKQNRVATGAIWYTRVLANDSVLRETNPDAKYEVAADLQGPKGLITTTSSVSSNGQMISKNAQNPEAAMKYVNWIQSDLENFFIAMFGIKGKHWEYVDEEKKIIKKLNRDYLGELLAGSSFAQTVKYQQEDPVSEPQFVYIRNYLTDMSRVKKPATFEVDFRFDQKAISDNIPTLADINRMIEEEVVKFIMGARPLADYDKFLQELNKAGLEKWIEVYTDQYNKASASK
ncbi:extracellular solute-binding protein [Paenibacillus eucommiae]|uniref:ABC-type glycerol-3-phosphate transport system substrate-binding protein n=1 Tax=Paenibacillus eucommiae TaxID=1355755 RepID=A0ABS4INH2_9BACL|nr:extracellular solute-binding protein [Paenibacillus eucommiae]MBP1988576.1 ABC-type glycerol-3-phosphate transport system substrate-binding protein [Paenibacillus eucommiae]